MTNFVLECKNNGEGIERAGKLKKLCEQLNFNFLLQSEWAEIVNALLFLLIFSRESEMLDIFVVVVYPFESQLYF